MGFDTSDPERPNRLALVQALQHLGRDRKASLERRITQLQSTGESRVLEADKQTRDVLLEKVGSVIRQLILDQAQECLVSFRIGRPVPTEVANPLGQESRGFYKLS